MKRYAPADEIFPTDRPLPPLLMVGRAEEASDLANALANGVNQILVGPRRTGKTTLARAALDRLLVYVAEVDLFSVVSLADLATRIVDAVVANRGQLATVRRALAKGGRNVASAATLSLGAHLGAELGEAVTVALDPKRGSDPLIALQQSLRLAQRIAEVDGQRFVLFLDEFQELAAPRHPLGDPDRVTKAMRATLQDCDRITTLFAGSVEHLLRDLFTPQHRAFHQWGAWHTLRPIRPTEWSAGLGLRLSQQGISASPKDIAELVAAAEGHPRVTMLLAKYAYMDAIAHGGNFTGATVGVALYSAAVADAEYHASIVSDLRASGRVVLDVAGRIARGEPPYCAASPSSVQRAIDALVKKGLVDKRGPLHRGGWRIVDPLLRAYLGQRGDPVPIGG